MGSTLTNGIYLPAEGERNCYTGLAANWSALDSLIGGYNAHIGNTTIHVTAEDKQAWNGKADASALNAHTGDATIHVTAEDKTKWDAVTSKADDSAVVHKTGNETKSGELTLSSTLKSSDIVPLTDLNFNLGSPDYKYNNVYAYMYNSIGRYFGNEANSNQRTNITLYANRDTQNQSCAFITRFRQNRAQGALQPTDLQKIGFDVLENEVRTNNVFDIQCTDWLNNVPRKVNIVSDAQSYSYGNSARKALFNDINPGALSLPDLTAGVDISGYITAGNNHNEYTPSVDGWISVALKSTSGACAVWIYQGDLFNGYYGSTARPGETEPFAVTCLPVKANTVVNIDTKGSNSYVYAAKFYPCTGNV